MKATHLIFASSVYEIVFGSGKQLSWTIMRAPSFSAGIKFPRIFRQYLSDQLWNTQRNR